VVAKRRRLLFNKYIGVIDQTNKMIIAVDAVNIFPFLVGWPTLMVCDTLWLLFATRAIRSYSDMGADVPPWKGGVAVLVYSFFASLAASSMTFESINDASYFGAMAGAVVFASYNITTLTVDKRWSFESAALDLVYGIASWCIMFIVMHATSETT